LGGCLPGMTKTRSPDPLKLAAGERDKHVSASVPLHPAGHGYFPSVVAILL